MKSNKNFNGARPQKMGVMSNRFDGGSCFDDSAKQTFNVQIANEDTVVRRIALFAGLFENTDEILSMGGMSVDALAKQGVVVTNTDEDALVTVTGKGLEYLQRHLRYNPTAVSQIQVTGKTELQLSQNIIYKNVHALSKSGEQSFTPREHQTEKNPNTTMVAIQFQELILGSESVLAIDVAPGDWVSLSISFGEAVDPFKKLAAYEASK